MKKITMNISTASVKNAPTTNLPPPFSKVSMA